MAKQSQPEKRHRQSEKRRERNYAYRSRLRTYIKRARLALVNDTEDKEELVAKACRELDRMVTKGVIKKNNASRSKSRLLQTLHGKRKLLLPHAAKSAASAKSGK